MVETTYKQSTVSWISHGEKYVFNQPDFRFPPVVSSSPFSGSDVKLSYVNGVKNPSWVRQIKSGIDATTHLDGVKYRFDDSDPVTAILAGEYVSGPIVVGSFNQAYQGKPLLFFPSLVGVVPDSVVTEVRNRAIRKFLDRAKSVRSSFEAGQDLGEIKQTIEGIIHPMNSLKKLTLGYLAKIKKSKQRYKRGPGLRKAVSDSYLEYRFGWRPLAMDVADAIVGLRDLSRMHDSTPVSASASGDHSASDGPAFPGPPPIQNLAYRQKTYSTYTVKISGAIRLGLVDGHIPLPQALQLSTLNDFAVTAWDLLPFSFVVDYFLNIGDVINAVTFPFSDFTYCCWTQRLTTSTNYRAVGVPVPSSDTVRITADRVSGGNATLSVIYVQRDRLQGIDLLPRVRFSLPVSARPWENIAALLSSNIRSLVPLKFT